MNLITNNKKKTIIVISTIIGIILLIYFGFAIYFMNHFYFGSKVNGSNISHKTVDEVENQIKSYISSYSIMIKCRDNVEETINAEDLGLEYISDGKIKELKNNQNPFTWVKSPFQSDELEMKVNIKYDEDLFNSKFNDLSCLKDENVIEPKNAYIDFNGNEFEIKSETMGNRIKKDDFYNKLVDAILSGNPTLDLESEDLYEKPAFYMNSEAVINAKDNLNKFISTAITYQIGSAMEGIDGKTIKDWVGVNEDFTTYIDEGKVRNYINQLAYKYNTVGKNKKFKTTEGNEIEVAGGNYGWRINIEKEVQDLYNSIENGEVATREINYIQKAHGYGDNEIGQTYVEIDFTKQHMWFYKDGNLVIDGDIVTGNVSLGHTTPTGAYRLNYKEANTNLVGEDYVSPVAFWMPFNGNIGIHDASWRDEFGKDIYLTNGSHGCVNAPYDLAQGIFNLIQPGDPVICYYS